MMDEYISVNLGKALKTEGVGENRIQSVLSNFSCPRNLDVEKFIREDAIAFSKKRQSITYLVFSLQEMKLAGFYSIAIKPVTIPAAAISKSLANGAAKNSDEEFDPRFHYWKNARMTEEMANYFLSIVQRVKNTRSHIRRILVEREMEMHETVASGVVSSPKEQVLNHHQTTNDYTMQETAASAATSAPSRTVTNHPEGRTGDIGMEGNAAAGAVSSPHETIGNNVNPRTGTLSGGVSGFAAIVVRNTKTTILNGAQRTQASVHGTVPRVAVGMASHSKITT